MLSFRLNFSLKFRFPVQVQVQVHVQVLIDAIPVSGLHHPLCCLGWPLRQSQTKTDTVTPPPLSQNQESNNCHTLYTHLLLTHTYLPDCVLTSSCLSADVTSLTMQLQIHRSQARGFATKRPHSGDPPPSNTGQPPNLPHPLIVESG